VTWHLLNIDSNKFQQNIHSLPKAILSFSFKISVSFDLGSDRRLQDTFRFSAIVRSADNKTAMGHSGPSEFWLWATAGHLDPRCSPGRII
jgi:hypothetical protein